MAPATSAAPSTVSDDGSGPTIKPVAVKAPPKACAPTDQDRYVYNPARLQVVTACLQVTGTVAAIRMEADGDPAAAIRSAESAVVPFNKEFGFADRRLTVLSRFGERSAGWKLGDRIRSGLS